MRKRKFAFSLQAKTAVMLMITFLIGLVFFVVVEFIGNFIVRTVFLSDERLNDCERRHIASLSEYVAHNGVVSSDSDAVQDWCHANSSVIISVYDGDVLLYEVSSSFLRVYNSADILSGSAGQDDLNINGSGSALGEYVKYKSNFNDSDLTADLMSEGMNIFNDRDTSEVYTVKRYSMPFADGNYYVSIIDFSSPNYYTVLDYVSIGLAFLSMMITIMVYNRTLTNRIRKLSDSVKYVRDGDITSDIRVGGNDELASLGESVDEMRKSIIRHYDSEQEALKLNNELLTSISHDIRTPLTSLLVYSEALAEEKAENSEKIREYASVCRDKAAQLKELTDTLFRYFLVYGESDVVLNFQLFEVSVLFGQIIGEHVVYLADNGYDVKTELNSEDYCIRTDVIMLKRVFDNIFSNIEKYADKDAQVTVSGSIEGARILVRISNSVKSGARAESTHIGLKTCGKIMSMLGGDFQVSEKDGFFSVCISQPLLSDETGSGSAAAK